MMIVIMYKQTIIKVSILFLETKDSIGVLDRYHP